MELNSPLVAGRFWMFGRLFSAGEPAALPIKIKKTSQGGVPQVYRIATYAHAQPDRGLYCWSLMKAANGKP